MDILENTALRYEEREKNDINPGKTKKGLYVVYPMRWIILFIFVLHSASNGLHAVQYSIIPDALVKYHGVTDLMVYWSALVYMLVYIPFVLPASWIVDKLGLRVAVILGAIGTSACAWLKVMAVSRDRFWLGFIAQVLAGVAQVFVLPLPPRVAAVWFGADQISTACSIGVLGFQLGIAIGYIIPPFLVHPENSVETLEEELRLMGYIVAGCTTAVLAAILLIFKAAPPSPPSAAVNIGSGLKSNFVQSIKNLFSNKNFILLNVAYGIVVGIYYAVSVVLNDLLLPHYPGMNEDIGRIGLVFMLTGMLGSVICGVILDKTHWYKEMTVGVGAATIASMLLFTFTQTCGYIGVAYFTIALLGFFIIGYVAIGLEFAVELTYPEPQGLSSGIITAMVQVFGIIFTVLFEWLLHIVGHLEANLAFCALLALGTGISVFIRSDLRRQTVKITRKY